MPITVATQDDASAIQALYEQAFPDNESALVAQLAVDLLAERSVPATIALVMVREAAVIAHVAFSPLSLSPDTGVTAYILAPFAVRPDYQKQGIGAAMLAHGKQQLAAAGAHLLFVYGDPAYYGQFGFSADTAAPFIPPYPLTHPFGWQAAVVRACDTGNTTAHVSCVPPLHNPVYW